MKLDEKIQILLPEFDYLASKFGDYAVRRAFKKWSWNLGMKKWRAKEEKDRKMKSVCRSVWAPLYEVFKK